MCLFLHLLLLECVKFVVTSAALFARSLFKKRCTKVRLSSVLRLLFFLHISNYKQVQERKYLEPLQGSLDVKAII